MKKKMKTSHMLPMLPILRRKYFLTLLIISFLISYITFTYYPLYYEITENKEDNSISESKCFDSDEERYMTYLPHSGFHNQRDSLENAVFMAWVLNRTLIMPPIIFSKKAYIPHRPFNVLYNTLHSYLTKSAISCKVKGTEHKNCRYTLLEWEELMNFDFIKKNIRYINRNDSSFDVKELYSFLNITEPERQVYVLAEESRYEYQFYDDKNITKVSDSQFKYLINLYNLRQRKEKLLHFGSIYNSFRFNLKLERNIKFFKSIREEMMINHPILMNISEKISEQLGGFGSYTGVHLRLGDDGYDRKFGQKAKENVNNIVETLLNEYDVPLTTAKLDEIDLDAFTKSFAPTETMMEAEKCMRSIPQEQHHFPTIYLACDKPRNDHRLRIFLRSFPCIFMLDSNFEKYLHPLNELKNPRDGVSLSRYFVPLIDGMVAARGGEFIGTPESTFSDYFIRLHEHWIDGIEP